MNALALSVLVLAACSGPDRDTGAAAEAEHEPATPAAQVTVGPDEDVPAAAAWEAPQIQVDQDDVEQLKDQAHQALEAGQLFGDDDDAIPLYLALKESSPDDEAVAVGLEHALAALLTRGNQLLADVDEEPGRLGEAAEIGAVARRVSPEDARVTAYLEQLEQAGQAQQANVRGERALNAGDIGEDGKGGAIGWFRRALELRPEDARAKQGLAAAESGLIRHAEQAAGDDNYAAADTWLDKAARVLPEMETVELAKARIAGLRSARIRGLRDQGIAALAQEDGLDIARAHLATLLRIAPAADPSALELRERIDLASHYGLFRPGQVFTEALRQGGRGPEMLVIPHGVFRIGAQAGEAGSTDAERPVRTIRFDRGLAVLRHEVTVGEFARFIAATNYRTRAARRGYSTVYDERSGNLVRRNGIDWRSDYVGARASDDLPVIHVSAKDADAYAEWLSDQTGHHYRLPSEAEFEYMLRAGNPGPFPWGDGVPPPDSGNFTGALDESPSGRHWRNAFAGYGDGAWGPAAVGTYSTNAFGLHDVAGNVSEWTGDCWHSSYRRAPATGKAWVNPGCEERVIRGGSWASSPDQTRSAWRLGSDADTTNARVGFRVVRDI